ncbi:hypothetical protein BDY24DRAFT_392818 [Mrakia frigida]|uniref:uncharacterized protein n=1 Tax=Mrakia frigida TaxID=29902 RepID=UPI003FCC0C69
MSSSSSLSSNPWAAWLRPLAPLDSEGSPWVDEPSRPTTSISSPMLQQQEESRQQQQRARRSTLIRRRVQFIETVEYVPARTWNQEEESSSSSEEQDRSGSPSESRRREPEEEEEDPIPTPQPSSAYSYFYNPSSSHPLLRLQPSFLFTPRTEPAPVAPALVNSLPSLLLPVPTPTHPLPT